MRTFSTSALLLFTLNCNQLFPTGFGFLFHHHPSPSSLSKPYRGRSSSSSSFHSHSFSLQVPVDTQNHNSKQHQRQRQRYGIAHSSTVLDDFSKGCIATTTNQKSHLISHLANQSSPTNKDDITQTQQHQQHQQQRLHPKPKAYKHLYRYYTDISVECWLATISPHNFLTSCGFTNDAIQRMSETNSKLLSLNVRGTLAPKVRFLVKAFDGGTGDVCSGVVGETSAGGSEDAEYCPHNLNLSSKIKSNALLLPLLSTYFCDMSLEKTVAPRHAYLVHSNLLHGRELWDDNAIGFQEFMNLCCEKKDDADFVELCNKWSSSSSPSFVHTIESFKTFSHIFSSGILSIARRTNNNHPSSYSSFVPTPAQMAILQLNHGANPMETDMVGIGLLQWMAGTGNADGLMVLLKTLVGEEEGENDVVGDVLLNSRKAKLGATALHWACAGVEDKSIGCGGHIDTCKLLLNKAGAKNKNLANAETTTGGTPLMWASWAANSSSRSSLDIIKLLLSNGANPHAIDENGANAADWALFGGNMLICRFWKDEFGMECAKFGP